MKRCSIENCNNFVWSKGLCKNHIPKTPIKRTQSINRKGWMKQVRDGQILPKMTAKNLAKEEMKLMFLDMWHNKPRKSEVSGVSIGNTFSSMYYHHILPKSKYPEAMLDPENIIILTGDEHANVENNIYKYDEINKRREALKIKYDL